MQMTLLGLGGATAATLTMEARRALESADLVVGAPRLLDALPALCSCTLNRAAAAAPEQILAALQVQPCRRAAVVFSGDSGFYSGARGLLPLLRENNIEATVFPGLSSVQLLAARLGRPWQGWRLVSAHGTACDAVWEVMQGAPAFFLTGGADGPAELCRRLTEAGLGDLPVTVGEDLAAEGERITRLTAAEAAQRVFSPLNVLLAEPAPRAPRRAPGWPDEAFLRGKTPMTKRFVRAAALALLGVGPDDVCWDIGAGTGSVSVELAAQARHVFAVECAPEACELIRQNRAKHCAWNLTLVEGRAPAALAGLPAPDAVFIGGSGGELPAILDTVFTANPAARVCISAVTLETPARAVQALTAHGVEAKVTQITVSESRAAGALHLLSAQNSVFLIAGNCP